MKKLIFSLLFLFFALYSFSQTEEIEKRNMQKRFEKGEFGKDMYISYAKQWRKLLNEFGGYPEFPIDSLTGDIIFIRKFNYPNYINKQIIFNRIKEWAAINFGNLDDVLKYENYDDGKIILKGHFLILTENKFNFFGFEMKGYVEKRCNETYIFTIKDNSVKIEIVNINYIYSSGGYYNTVSNSYTSQISHEIPINYYYPITNSDAKYWSDNLHLLVKTKNIIFNLFNRIDRYILNYDVDYSF